MARIQCLYTFMTLKTTKSLFHRHSSFLPQWTLPEKISNFWLLINRNTSQVEPITQFYSFSLRVGALKQKYYFPQSPNCTILHSFWQSISPLILTNILLVQTASYSAVQIVNAFPVQRLILVNPEKVLPVRKKWIEKFLSTLNADMLHLSNESSRIYILYFMFRRFYWYWYHQNWYWID